MRSYEFLDEIERVPAQSFSVDKVKYLLSLSKKVGNIEEFDLHLTENGNQRFVILTKDNIISAFAGFELWLNGHQMVWQARNAETFPRLKVEL